MPKRTRSHKIEEASRVQLRETFNKCGWVVWDLHPDYGEDLLVRIFIADTATHYSFFIQAKATDHIDRYISKDKKHISFPIDIDHLKHWAKFWEPVIFTVWDTKSNTTYWEIIQDTPLINQISENKKETHIDIPMDNILDTHGLKEIFQRTKTRFRRFEVTCEGVTVLKNLVEKQLNVSLNYTAGEDYLEVVNNDTEDFYIEVYPLGELREMLKGLAQMQGMTWEQFSKNFAEEVKNAWVDAGRKKLEELQLD